VKNRVVFALGLGAVAGNPSVYPNYYLDNLYNNNNNKGNSSIKLIDGVYKQPAVE
jgi:hypothetical protein